MNIEIQYSLANNSSDLKQIIALQEINLESNISNKEGQEQDFVTVQHNMEILTAMNQKHQHVVAKHDGIVIGYALCMLKEFGQQIPFLIPMFDLIESLTYKNSKLSKASYFTMGQICIDKAYRGQGVFRGLYTEMKKQLSIRFEYCITEVAYRNKRSLKAHEKVGFRLLHRYTVENGEVWDVLIWDWG